MPRGRRLGVLVLVLGVVVIAAALAGWRLWGGRSEYDGNLMISSARAAPGETVELTFVAGYDHTSMFMLYRMGSSKPSYFLYSASDRGRAEPSWTRAEDVPEGAGFSAIGRTDPGPERVVIPPPVADGEYSVCAVAKVMSCALLTVGR
ncbi:hypothetical protein [Streptomyces sp. SID13031]|uniref:hypothetical protein n=1 Tax=Streptomyces sp. SID13031 TaxID=2706046 RepID=UPI0013CB4873|nr:hypothetical protein [Streptomyces sp. SID13031]NEA35912.1 hypothetical protein [Streptomyces sp. SID13031]